MRARGIFAWFLTLAATAGSAAAQPADFGRDIQPLLSDRCYACHGPDAANRKANLRLDQREAALAAIHPGDPDASLLIQRIESDDAVRRMPPAYLGHDPLEVDEIALLRRWVEQGAEYETHWSFTPPARPDPPVTRDANWAKNEIDAFVLARLETAGLQPSPAAEPGTWLRRMRLDLVGTPPTPGEIEAFEKAVAARGEGAYKEAVEQAFASPHYGERMALDWLDVARYADTHGFNNDSSRSMWPWRDWVIQAFNRNLPYDRFITEQLAGDLLDEPTHDQLVATGFNRNHVINSEGGIIEEEYRVEYVVDRVRTLGMAWLGLSIECARCHDHKFDPISQKDYYRFYAFFNNVPERGEAGRVANAVPMIQAPSAAERETMAELRARIDELEAERAARFAAWKPDKDEIERLRRRPVAPPSDPILRVSCEEIGSKKGVNGKACRDQELKVDKVSVPSSSDLSLSLWVRPKGEHEAPLFSSVDYEPEEASARHGAGTELRLVGSEVELRLNRRYPSYAIIVRSRGAGLQADQWSHIAATYTRGDDAGMAMRSKAAWVRLYVDGREVGMEILHDGLQSDALVFKAPFRLGRDNAADSDRLGGRLDEIQVWDRGLSPEEVRAEFERSAFQRKPASRWVFDTLHPAPELDRLRAELFEIERNVPTTMVMAEMDEPRQTHVLLRGMYDAPGEPVQPGVPEDILGAWPEGAPVNRLGLAQWLTRPDHPTTARVVVNRFWQQVFGTGLVKTSGDLGLQGEAPSHPELLDWLAVDFIESGWDVQRLMRNIVLSATYRQDSSASEELIERDPENRLLARGPRLRLPAELIRDQALEISGLLSDKVGGPSVFPYQPDGLYNGIVVGASYPGTVWEQSSGEDLYRRSLYTFWKRTLPHPTMTVFDAPDREFCTVQRSRTNTPLQALTLMNDPIFVEAARALAERVLREGGPTPEERIELAFRLAAGRAPDSDELEILRRSLIQLLVSYENAENEARGLLSVGASPAAPEIPARVLAAYTALASMILNLDEVITKG